MKPRLPILQPTLIDAFGRVHSAIRISVTDRCNIRCRYCMPGGAVAFLEEHRYLDFAAITRFVRLLVGMGIRKVRITGGEPLMRRRLPDLIQSLSSIDGLEDLALTTNGMLLDEQAEPLRQAGLRRVNISLDTLQESTFQRISRRPGIESVLKGLTKACAVGFEVRLNALMMRSINLPELVELIAFTRERNLGLRFIEFMPLDADRQWSRSEMVSGSELRQLITSQFGELIPVDRADPSQPASQFRFADGRGELGFIDSVTEPFCGSCNRLRLTAEGQLHNCLFGREAWDVGAVLRNGGSDEKLTELVRDCVAHKFAAHGISDVGFAPPPRAMYQIGG